MSLYLQASESPLTKCGAQTGVSSMLPSAVKVGSPPRQACFAFPATVFVNKKKHVSRENQLFLLTSAVFRTFATTETQPRMGALCFFSIFFLSLGNWCPLFPCGNGRLHNKHPSVYCMADTVPVTAKRTEMYQRDSPGERPPGVGS